MRRACSVLLLVFTGVAAAGALATGVLADGLPVLGIDVGASGVASSGGGSRFVTLPVGSGTLVARIDPNGGRVLVSRRLAGSFTIPAVAYDGSAGGLSHDGRTLVLIEPRQSFPRARTTFSVLSTTQLRPLQTIHLRGDFSFDAISPDGSRIYLIQYSTPTDPSRYLVRAYDLHSGRLLTKPITDPRERSDKMRGSPITRTTSRDGRYAYTLYDGAGSTPFIHALDTSHGTATCIDLDILAGNDNLWRQRLTLDPNGTLAIHSGPTIEAIVNTRTYQVSAPAPASTAPAATNRPSTTRLTTLTTTALLTAIALLATALAVARHRRITHESPRAAEMHQPST